MKWSFASVGLIVFGLIGVTIIMLFEQLTTTNESDYYMLKEVTEAAMIDAIDLKYYRETGDLKIIKEKFVENFTRRFAESTLLIGTGYHVYFYNIMETPPKVTISINSTLREYTIFNDTTAANVNNTLTGILEYTNKDSSSSSEISSNEKVYETREFSKTYYNIIDIKNNVAAITERVNIPEKLKQIGIKDVKIKEIKDIKIVSEEQDLLDAMLEREIDWASATKQDKRTNFSIENLDINNYYTGITINNVPQYYNCHEKKGTFDGSDYCNSGEKNEYYISWTSPELNTAKEKIVISYTIVWEYQEYIK